MWGRIMGWGFVATTSVASAVGALIGTLAEPAVPDMATGSNPRSARKRVNSARPTSEIASSSEMLSRPVNRRIEPVSKWRTTLEIQLRWLIAACGRLLPSLASAADRASSPSPQGTRACAGVLLSRAERTSRPVEIRSTQTDVRC